ncbi:MAG: thioredoxin [Roseiflexaceae bacterium]
MSDRISESVIDVDAADFQDAVIAQSSIRPVIVDFWAPWCGPCRTLGPILERLAQESDGAWLLAKINVDNNQRIAQQYGVQGIPAVKAFKNGAISEQFTGAIPESQIRTWLKRIIPDAADTQLSTLIALASSNPHAAKAQLASFVSTHPQHTEALLVYAGLLVRSNDHAAMDYLQQIPSHSPLYSRAQAWRMLAQGIQSSVVVESHPTAQRFAEAMHAFCQHNDAHIVDVLLQIVGTDRKWENDLARTTLLALFTILGDAHPLVPEARRQLAALLF